MDNPRIHVDFNERVADDLVLLSKTDVVKDSNGTEVTLREGMRISVYEYNEYKNGEKEYLLADGVVEKNDPRKNGEWTKAAKWCCRIDQNGIRHID